MKLITPDWRLDGVENNVYEPAEDTFLLLDVLEDELEFLKVSKPSIIVEVGCGSGVIITAVKSAFGNSCHCIATDINKTACEITCKTAILNNCKIEVLEMDLMNNIKDGVVDVLIFNPPYVLTDPEEIIGKGIERSWAGGIKGRQIMDKLFEQLSRISSTKCVFYLVVIDENCPEEIINLMFQLGFDGNKIKSRKIRGEHLSVMKFVRKVEKP